MATRTFTIAKDGSVMAGYDSGNFNDQHLPCGTNGTHTWRPLLKFNLDFSGMVAIQSATLHLRTVLYHVGRGSSAYVRARRITSSWTGSGGSENTWSAQASPKWSTQPSDTTTDQSPATAVPSSYDTWFTIDVTAIVQSWFGGAANYGIKLYAVNSSGTVQEGSDVYRSEYYSSLSSYDPYITVTYSTNQAPNAPTNLSPSGGTRVLPTPTLGFSWSDPDGDNIASYDIQVSTDSTFASVTHWNATGLTSGINTTAKTVSVAYGGTALSRGTTYYWRARCKDPSGATGAWSAAASFRVNQLPSVSLTEPSASGRLGKLTYQAGSGWASPRLVVAWTYSDPDGTAQASYRLRVYNDSGGSPGTTLYDSGQVAGTTSTLTVPANLTEAAYYHVQVQVWDDLGESATSATYRIRVRWGLTQHHKDLGSVPTTWSISQIATTTGSTNAVVIEYNSADDSAGTNLGAWQADLASVTKRRWFRYRVWLLAWGASPATSPSFDKLVLSYSVQVSVPDGWGATAGMSLDPATKVYGTQSLRMDGGSTGWRYAYQDIDVEPNTYYMLSGFIKTSVASGGQVTLEIKDPVTDTWYAGMPYITATKDWERYAIAAPWYSGAVTRVRVKCLVNGAGTVAWFDALKLEASTVVTPWSPSVVGDAVTLDAGGIQVDKTAGGIMRLRGSQGGTRDTVELGARGLVFGGDTELYSPAAARLQSGATILDLGTTTRMAEASSGLSFLTQAGAALVTRHKGVLLSTSYSDPAPPDAGIQFGADTKLYRAGAGILKTDGELWVKGSTTVDPAIRLWDQGIEVRGSTPYVDFSNDASVDYDVRLRLLTDVLLALEGGALRHSSFPGFFWYYNSNTGIGSMANGAVVTVSFSGTPTRDAYGFWSSGTPTRITIPSALGTGVYLLIVHLDWSGATSSGGLGRMQARLNGTTTIAEADTYISGSSGYWATLVTHYLFSAGNYIEIVLTNITGQTRSPILKSVSLVLVSE